MAIYPEDRPEMERQEDTVRELLQRAEYLRGKRFLRALGMIGGIADHLANFEEILSDAAELDIDEEAASVIDIHATDDHAQPAERLHVATPEDAEHQAGRTPELAAETLSEDEVAMEVKDYLRENSGDYFKITEIPPLASVDDPSARRSILQIARRLLSEEGYDVITKDKARATKYSCVPHGEASDDEPVRSPEEEPAPLQPQVAAVQPVRVDARPEVRQSNVVVEIAPWGLQRRERSNIAIVGGVRKNLPPACFVIFDALMAHGSVEYSDLKNTVEAEGYRCDPAKLNEWLGAIQAFFEEAGVDKKFYEDSIDRETRTIRMKRYAA